MGVEAGPGAVEVEARDEKLVFNTQLESELLSCGQKPWEASFSSSTLAFRLRSVWNLKAFSVASFILNLI